MPEAKVPGMGHTMAQHPKENLVAGATVKMANGEVKSGQQVYEGRSQTQGMKANGVGAAQEQIDDIQQYGFDLSFNLWLITIVAGRSIAAILKLRSEA